MKLFTAAGILCAGVTAIYAANTCYEKMCGRSAFVAAKEATTQWADNAKAYLPQAVCVIRPSISCPR